MASPVTRFRTLRLLTFAALWFFAGGSDAQAQAPPPDTRERVTGRWHDIPAMTVAEVGEPLSPEMRQQLERDLRAAANVIRQSLTPLQGFDGTIRLQAGFERWWPVAPWMVTCDTTLYPPPETGPVLAFVLANFAEYSETGAGVMQPGAATVSISGKSVV